MRKFAVAGKPQEGSSPIQVEEKVLNIYNNEQLEEGYLTEINPKGQVPVLVSSDASKKIPDSLDITFFLAERYPDLMPNAHEDDIRSLLKELHALNYFSLSFPGRPQMVQGMLKGIEDRIARKGISDKYREALKYKLSVTTKEKLDGIQPDAVQKNEEKASSLVAALESRLSGPGPWLFGLDRPTALDAHLVIFIARMEDVGRGSLIPDRLRKYAEAAFQTPELQAVMDNRRTMAGKFADRHSIAQERLQRFRRPTTGTVSTAADNPTHAPLGVAPSEMRLVGVRAAHGNVLKLSLRRSLLPHCRPFSTDLNLPAEADYLPRDTPNPHARDIAVLGAGITGLSAAYHVAKTIRGAKVTVYEKSDRIGGWVDSERVQVDGGHVLFEWGPRTLRPDFEGAGSATQSLVRDLEMDDSVIRIPKSAPAARNRYIYYPDHLARMPVPPRGMMDILSNLYTVFTEPVFKGVISGLLAEPSVLQRNANLRDESIGHLLRRRFGAKAADNLASAVFHGIYAGDLYKLSARTLLPRLWYLETRDPEGSGLLAEMGDLTMRGQMMAAFKDIQFHNMLTISYGRDVPKEELRSQRSPLTFPLSFRGTSVYTFVGGLGELVSNLERSLRGSSNVTFKLGSAVDNVDFTSQRKLLVQAGGSSSEHDYAISTLGPRTLTSSFTNSPSLAANASIRGSSFKDACDFIDETVNVMVVNLYYDQPGLIPSSHAGFGYLIPRSVDLDQNPERALGVIFGSETSGAREAALIPRSEDDPVAQQDTAPGTKLTVMMGGHWWSDWADSDLPSEDEAVEMAKSLLRRHLNIDVAPAVAKARLNRNCIPQYRVGYKDKLNDVNDALVSDLDGRLKLAGPYWQGGVGVNDCVRSARLAALAIREGWDHDVGIKGFAKGSKWCLYDQKTATMRMDPMNDD